MGEIIRKNAAVDDIIADLEITLTNATARGGDLLALAGEHVAPTVALVTELRAKLAEAQAAVAPLVATLDAADDAADRLLGEVSDALWNALGRPGADPFLTVLFPGGIAFYAEGADEGQPDRMQLLAELLEKGVHPKLDPALAASSASKVRASADAYRAALEAARVPRAQVTMLQRARTALARAGQVGLAAYKRALRAKGLSEADIHRVIPDRPASKAKPEPAPAPAPAPGG